MLSHVVFLFIGTVVVLTLCRLQMITFLKAKALKKITLLTMGAMVIYFSASRLLLEKKNLLRL